MLEEKRYTLSELSRTLAESTKNEFKPTLGPGVVQKDKQNNGKAVNDIMKEVDKYNPKAEKRDAPSENTNDTNKGMLEWDYDVIDDKTRERHEALALGYSSVINKKNTDDEDSGADREGNKRYLDQRKKVEKARSEDEEAIKTAGLATREIVKKSENKKDAIKRKTSLGESKNMKRLHFKNTTFLSEAHMLKKVPDDYKYDGNKFIMKDSVGTEYIVECRVDPEFKNVEFDVVNKYNTQQISEQLGRMRELFNYDRSDNSQDTLRENREQGTNGFTEALNRMRELGEK